MDNAQSGGDDYSQLDRRVIALWRLTGCIGAGVISLAILAGGTAGLFGSQIGALPRLLGFAGLLLPIGLLWVRALLWPPLRYRHTSYRVTPGALEIRHGVVWRVMIHVPRSRVQHTDVTRGPLERSFGLATLVVYTAGTERASISLEGLDGDSATEIRDRLIPEGADDAV